MSKSKKTNKKNTNQPIIKKETLATNEANIAKSVIKVTGTKLIPEKIDTKKEAKKIAQENSIDNDYSPETINKELNLRPKLPSKLSLTSLYEPNSSNIKTAFKILTLILVCGLIGFFVLGMNQPNTTNKAVDKKPVIAKSMNMDDKNLIIEDTLVGTGKEVVSGSRVKIHYKGTLLPKEGEVEGPMFDSSYKRNEPLDTPIGVGRLIKGWDLGIVGMKEGGKRKLTIAPDYAYGSADLGPNLPPNSTLVFDVELVEVVN